MTRDDLITAAVTAFNNTTGTQAEKLRAGFQVAIEGLKEDHLAITTSEGTRFVRRLTMDPAEVIPGRPVYPDVIGFAVAMENAITAAKGTANDPDAKTTPQLVAMARALAVALPGQIDAGTPGPVLTSIVRLAAIATVIQARLI